MGSHSDLLSLVLSACPCFEEDLERFEPWTQSHTRPPKPLVAMRERGTSEKATAFKARFLVTSGQPSRTGSSIYRRSVRRNGQTHPQRSNPSKRAKPQSVGASGPGKSSTRSPDQAGPSPSADSSLTRSHRQSHISVHPHIVCTGWLQTCVHLLYKSIKNDFHRKFGRVFNHTSPVAL